MSLHFVEELESMKIDFGPELDIQLKELVTEFSDVAHEPQGLPLHRGIQESLIIQFVLPLIIRVNNVTVFLVLNMRSLRDSVLIFSNRDWSVSQLVIMLHLLSRFGILMVLFGYVSILDH
jgi:hypothetical protein